jgi:hypothetical protein
VHPSLPCSDALTDCISSALSHSFAGSLGFGIPVDYDLPVHRPAFFAKNHAILSADPPGSTLASSETEHIGQAARNKSFTLHVRSLVGLSLPIPTTVGRTDHIMQKVPASVVPGGQFVKTWVAFKSGVA